jgi:hypothetical protein
METIEYRPNGSLSRRVRTSKGLPEQEWMYFYDPRGWLSVIKDGSHVDNIVYSDDGCPKYASENGLGFSYTSDHGRLTGYSSGGVVSPILYGSDGLISAFQSIVGPFAPLTYQPGQARGYDLFPAPYMGGLLYGFPERTEVMRLDGRCDPTLSSQEKILSVIVTSVPWIKPPVDSGG